MSELKNSDIKELMQNVANTHPLIGIPADATKSRFYGFNPEALDTGTKSKLNFDTLVMGLSLPKEFTVGWNYLDTGTSTLKQKYFQIAVLGKFASDNYEAEDNVCERAEQVLDDFQTWLDNVSAGEERCDFPVIELIDRKNIGCRRVNNIGIAKLCGAVMRLPLQEFVEYDENVNPLDAMVP